MELNGQVQDQPPGQVAPRLAPLNPVEHLPNVPSYHPPITRIPVLISRRTTLSNSSFAKETRSSIRRLGSVSPPTQHARALVCASAWLGLFPSAGALVSTWTTSWAHGKPSLPLLASAFLMLRGDLKGTSLLLPGPKIPQLAIHVFGLNVAFSRSSSFVQIVTHTLV